MSKELELKDIYGLIDRFESSSLSGLDVELGESRISIRREAAGAGKVVAPVINVEKAPQAAPETAGAIRANVVGSFYRAPSPEAEPFVKVGDSVKKGDVVAIIEAMKVMNEVTSPFDGIVTSIDVEDGALVEFDQILMRLDTPDV